MIVKNSQDTMISDSLLFDVTECDLLNSEGIICASPDEIKNYI